MWKLRFVITSIQQACYTYYAPYKQISIDERMVASKARIGFKQYQKDKPTKWDFKLWILACPISGYTLKFNVYTGKEDGPKAPHGLAYEVVFKVTEGFS
jgi:hypothetical protein